MKIGTLLAIMSKHALDSKVQNFYFLENIQTNMHQMSRMTIDLMLFNARYFVKFFFSLFFRNNGKIKVFIRYRLKIADFGVKAVLRYKGLF